MGWGLCMADTPPKTEQIPQQPFSVSPCFRVREALDRPLLRCFTRSLILLARLRVHYMAPTHQKKIQKRNETTRKKAKARFRSNEACVCMMSLKRRPVGVCLFTAFSLSLVSPPRVLPLRPAPCMYCGALFLFSFRLFPSSFSPQTLTHTHIPTLLSHTHSTSHTRHRHTHRTNEQKEGGMEGYKLKCVDESLIAF